MKCAKDRVSVIIPTYNYACFLPYAIESVLSQKYQDLEVLVVDDGSTDETPQILSQFKSRIKYIHQENAGLSAARNKGIAHSTGEFIQFLDADDILGPRSIHSQIKFLNEYSNISISVCRNKLFKSIGSTGIPEPTGEWPLFRESLSVHLCFLNIAPPHAFLSRREAIVKTGWFDTGLKACEDYEFWLRAATKGFAPSYNPDGIVYYRRHPTSMSAKVSQQVYYDSIVNKRLSTFFDRFPYFPENDRLEALIAFCAGSVYTAGKLKNYYPDLVNQVMKSARKHITEARELAFSQPCDWNILIKLNYTRIVSFLAHPFFQNHRIALGILENLNQILSAVKAPNRKLLLINNLTLSAVSDPKICIVEKNALKGLFFRYIKNYLLRLVWRCRLNKFVKMLTN